MEPPAPDTNTDRPCRSSRTESSSSWTCCLPSRSSICAQADLPLDDLSDRRKDAQRHANVLTGLRHAADQIARGRRDRKQHLPHAEGLDDGADGRAVAEDRHAVQGAANLPPVVVDEPDRLQVEGWVPQDVPEQHRAGVTGADDEDARSIR